MDIEDRIATRIALARSDQKFYRDRAFAAADLDNYEVAVASFGEWKRLQAQAEEVERVLVRLLAEEDPIDQAKRAAEIAEQGPGSLVEAYGR